MTAHREYWPALDGLRGVAILLVVVAHAGIVLSPVGGQVGVTLFFVLSGFLITTILASEQKGSGSIDLKKFYLRRARRLLPALFFFLVVSGLVLSVAVDRFPYWASSWPGLFYVSNYAQILGFTSYANSHLWSLSVEEHFYALWPLAILLLHRIPPAKTLLKLAIGSIILRIALGILNPFWAYHGTLTNSYALLLGCAIAVARSEGRLYRLSAGSGHLGVTLLVGLSLWPTGGEEDLLRLGIWIPVVAAAISGWVIISFVVSGSKAMTSAWLRYLGKVSYGWYLWHAPFLFIAVFNDSGIKRFAFLVLTLVVATISWRFVERPFLVRRTSVSPSETSSTRSTIQLESS